MSVDNLERRPVYPPESWGWQTMERFFLDTARLAGYLELRCPAGKEAPADVREIFAAQSGPAKYSLLFPCRKIGAAVLGTSSLTAAAEEHLARRAAPMRTGLVMFSNSYGLLAVSDTAKEILNDCGQTL